MSGNGERTGRKPILDADPEKIKRLLNYLRVGMYVTQACDMVGVSRASYFSWINRAKKIEKSDDEVAPDDEIYMEFLDSTKKARAEAEAYHLKNVRDAGETSWQASAWWLERSHPDRWGRRERVEVVGKDEGPVVIKIEFGD